jgi:23S rRNA (adenine2503-C2)-methyltransferase
VNVFDDLQQLTQWITDRGHSEFRSRQIAHWIFEKRATGFSEMTDLPQPLREQLNQICSVFSTRVVRRERSTDGTEKLLVQLADDRTVECVLLRDGARRTICVSSQVGCAMGCVFCASGLDGVERNLTAGEILQQMLHLQHLLPSSERLSHIVMMGMGEPLANLDNVLQALSTASQRNGLMISPRRITISTVGLPKRF